MSGPAYEIITRKIEEVTGERPGEERGRWRCPIPGAHSPNDPPTLAVTNGDGKTVTLCSGGCNERAVLAELGLEWRDRFDDTHRTTPTVQVVPHDAPTEAAFLGALLLRPGVLEAISLVDVDLDFWNPSHRAIAAALASHYASGATTGDPVEVGRILRADPPHGLDGNRLAALINDVMASTGASDPHVYLAALRRLRVRREHLRLAHDLATAARDGKDTDDLIDELISARQIRSADGAAPNVVDFVHDTEPDYDWLIPGLLEAGDRVILTGPEGGGKSTLLRQVAVQCGGGIHPFNGETIDPVTVLYVDLENPRRQLRRKLRPLVTRMSQQGRTPELCAHTYIRPRPQGLDLLHNDDVTWLREQVITHAPRLLIIGPIYKMANGDPTSEEVAKKVSTVLDQLRADHDLALLIEAHTPHGKEKRPYGASLWKRWPEFGIHVAKSGVVDHWRGQRDERDWPPGLKRGGSWPWEPVTNGPALTFARMIEHVRTAERIDSNRAIAAELGVSETTIRRAIEANQTQWNELRNELGGGDK